MSFHFNDSALPLQWLLAFDLNEERKVSFDLVKEDCCFLVAPFSLLCSSADLRRRACSPSDTHRGEMRQEGREQVSNLDWVAWVSSPDEILLLRRRAWVVGWSKISSCSILWAAEESILCFHRIASDSSPRWRRFLRLWDRRTLCYLRILSSALRSILLDRLSVCSSRVSSPTSSLNLRDDRDTSLWSKKPRRNKDTPNSFDRERQF